MNNRLEMKLKYFWCLMSAVSLLLPLYPYSYAMPAAEFGSVMMPALIIMLVITLPVSFFAMPLFVLFKLILEIEPDSMFGAYLYVVLLNIIGYVQWLWLVPRLSGNRKPFALPSIMNNN